MNAPLPPFYLHCRLLLQHPFRRSLLAARRQGVHSGWCMPSLKDTQGNHTNCPKEQSSWRPLPSHPFLVLQPGGTLQSSSRAGHSSCLCFAYPILAPDAKLGSAWQRTWGAAGEPHSLVSISSYHSPGPFFQLQGQEGQGVSSQALWPNQ